MPGPPVQEDTLAERTLEQPAKRWARNYETIYILRPNVDSDEVAKVAKRVRDVMDRMGGKLTKVDVWGKRRLAYHIGNYTRGIFVYLGYSAHGDLIAELERNLRLLDPIIRYQTIVVEDGIELDEVEIDASEVEWADIELGDDDDDEPTTAERLGMEDRSAKEEKAEAKGDDAEGDSDEEKAEAKDDSDEEKAEAKDDSDEEKAEAKDDSDEEKAEAKSDDAEGDDAKEEEPKKAEAKSEEEE